MLLWLRERGRDLERCRLLEVSCLYMHTMRDMAVLVGSLALAKSLNEEAGIQSNHSIPCHPLKVHLVAQQQFLN